MGRDISSRGWSPHTFPGTSDDEDEGIVSSPEPSQRNITELPIFSFKHRTRENDSQPEYSLQKSASSLHDSTPSPQNSVSMGHDYTVLQLLDEGVDVSCQDHSELTELYETADTSSILAISYQDNNKSIPHLCQHNRHIARYGATAILSSQPLGAKTSFQDQKPRAALHEAAVLASHFIISHPFAKGAGVTFQDTAFHEAVAVVSFSFISRLLGSRKSRNTALHPTVGKWHSGRLVKGSIELEANDSWQGKSEKVVLRAPPAGVRDSSVFKQTILLEESHSCHNGDTTTEGPMGASVSDQWCSKDTTLRLAPFLKGPSGTGTNTSRQEDSIQAECRHSPWGNGPKVVKGPLSLNATACDVEAITSPLSKNGPEISCQGSDRCTACQLVVFWSHPSHASLLLEDEAHMKSHQGIGHTAIHSGACNGSLGLIEEFRGLGVDILCLRGKGDMVAPIRVRVDRPKCSACRIVERPTKSGPSVSCLERTVPCLFKRGANIPCQECKGWTALELPAKGDQSSIVSLLFGMETDILCQESKERTARANISNRGGFGGSGGSRFHNVVKRLVGGIASALGKRSKGQILPPTLVYRVTGLETAVLCQEGDSTRLSLMTPRNQAVAHLLNENKLGTSSFSHDGGTLPISRPEPTIHTQICNYSSLQRRYTLADRTIGRDDSSNVGGINTYGEDGNEWGYNSKGDICFMNATRFKRQMRVSSRNGGKSPELGIEDSVIPTSTLSSDSMAGISSTSTDVAMIEDDGLEDGDDEMEISLGDDISCYVLETARRGVVSYPHRLGGWKGVADGSRKRSADKSFTNQPVDSEGEAGTSYAPRKRLKGANEGQSKISDRPKRAFACPYYKKNPFKYSSCSEWRDIKIRRVREHCKKSHLKLLRCGRCKKFRAGNYEEITQHLENENCEKAGTSGPLEEDTDREKADELDKARTWQEIYEILFPLHIPNQFWQNQMEVLMTPIEDNELSVTLRARAAICPNKRMYQLGLAEFLKYRLGLGEGVVEELLSEYDNDWTAKNCSSPTSLLNDAIDCGRGITVKYFSAQQNGTQQPVKLPIQRRNSISRQNSLQASFQVEP